MSRLESQGLDTGAEATGADATGSDRGATREGQAVRVAARKVSAMNYEIGVVYRRGGRLFLAVTERTLITFKDGEMQEVRPQARYEMVRSISCEDLVARWGITLERLDGVTAAFLAPSTEGLKTRPRGSRRQRAADESAWRELRTIRLLAG